MSRPITFSASCAFAVSISTGVRIFARRRSRQTSKPSFSGSMTSSRIRSQPGSRARRLASSPSLDHLDVVAFVAKIELEAQRDVGFVFDDQNSRHHLTPLRAARW